ncbi:MAG: hypothetical protein H7Z42_04285, partial [Roseiflexaceae bacterium]|nr:hypothetical protein [Roseiflexaceae bacterium]
MSTRSFPVGENPRVMIIGCEGSLTIEAHDERTVAFEIDGQANITETDEGLRLQDAQDDLTVYAPHDATIVVERVEGDAAVQGIMAVELRNIQGDTEVHDITGHVRLEKIEGDVEVEQAGSLHVEGRIAGNAEIEQVGTVVIEGVDGELELEQCDSAVIGAVGGNAEATQIRRELRYGSIGGDLAVEDSPEAEIAGGSVGGDLKIDGARSIEAGDVGGDAALKASASIVAGSIGGDLEAACEGTLMVGQVGGDAELRAGGVVQIGSVGSDVELAASFDASSMMQLTVGGDATIKIPDAADVTIRATVGGQISGHQLASSSVGQFTVVYGEGQGQLQLIVGGDLELGGRREPHASHAGWGGVGREFGQFGAEMGRLGIELGRIGAELGRELAGSFGGSKAGADWQQKFERQAAKLARAAEERTRKAQADAERLAERFARESTRAGDRVGRVTVRKGNREWSFDQERLERIQREARAAA